MRCENPKCHYSGPRAFVYIHGTQLLCEYCAPSGQKHIIEDSDLYYVNNTGKEECRYRELDQIDIKGLIFIVSEE